MVTQDFSIVVPPALRTPSEREKLVAEIALEAQRASAERDWRREFPEAVNCWEGSEGKLRALEKHLAELDEEVRRSRFRQIVDHYVNACTEIRGANRRAAVIPDLEREKRGIPGGYDALRLGAHRRTGPIGNPEDKTQRERAKTYLEIEAQIARLSGDVASAVHRRAQMEIDHPFLRELGVQLDGDA